MIEYMANNFTAIFPFGIIAKGEILTKEQAETLGEATLADMVGRGVLTKLGGQRERINAPQAGMAAGADTQAAAAEDAPDDAPEIAPVNTPEDADDEDAEALEPDTMDDVVDEAKEPKPAPAEKPKKKHGAAPDSQNQPSAVAKGDLETQRVSNLGGRKAK